MAVGLNAGGGFCAGMEHVTHHQVSSRRGRSTRPTAEHDGPTANQRSSLRFLSRDAWTFGNDRIGCH